jgi:tRNA threonylcarbamoyladenosine biosynthesis protein TsaB
MLLAIDTATRYASIALYDESGIRAEQTWRSGRNHSVEVMPAIAAMLAQQRRTMNDLTAVAVAGGPGSFTGPRIGMSNAKGICLALEIPIIAVPTLDVVTYAVGDPGEPVFAVLEAGRGRISVAEYAFEDGLPVQRGELMLAASDEWAPPADEPILVAGEVSATLADHLLSLPQADNIAITSLAGSLRRAGYLAELAWERLQTGRTDDLAALSPIYGYAPLSGTAPEAPAAGA